MNDKQTNTEAKAEFSPKRLKFNLNNEFNNSIKKSKKGISNSGFTDFSKKKNPNRNILTGTGTKTIIPKVIDFTRYESLDIRQQTDEQEKTKENHDLKSKNCDNLIKQSMDKEISHETGFPEYKTPVIKKMKLTEQKNLKHKLNVEIFKVELNDDNAISENSELNRKIKDIFQRQKSMCQGTSPNMKPINKRPFITATMNDNIVSHQKELIIDRKPPILNLISTSKERSNSNKSHRSRSQSDSDNLSEKSLERRMNAKKYQRSNTLKKNDLDNIGFTLNIQRKDSCIPTIKNDINIDTEEIYYGNNKFVDNKNTTSKFFKKPKKDGKTHKKVLQRSPKKINDGGIFGKLDFSIDGNSKDNLKNSLNSLNHFKINGINFKKNNIDKSSLKNASNDLGSSQMNKPNLMQFLENNNNQSDHIDEELDIKGHKKTKSFGIKNTLFDLKMIRETSSVRLDNTFTQPDSFFRLQYNVEKKYHKGTLGTTYIAENRFDKLIYAIKMFKPEIDQETVQRIAERGRRQESTHLTRYFLSWSENNRIYLVSEKCQQNLRQLAGSTKKVTEDILRKLVRDVCKALLVLHNDGCLHLNLKPENILLSHHGKFKITDATPFTNIEETVKRIDRRYIAPELTSQSQLSSKQLKKADIFSLGIILFEIMVQGDITLPKDGHLWKKLRNDQVDSMLSRYPVTNSFKRIVTKMMSSKPSKRPTAESLIQSLISSKKKKNNTGLEEKLKDLERELAIYEKRLEEVQAQAATVH